MLSVRLQAVADMVTPKNIIADIGTDHGYVPIYLVKNNISPYAYAMDINEGPITRAKNNISMEGLSDKISTAKSNGMEKLEPGMADTAIIAGMGGELIIQILKEAKAMEMLKELVLSPHKSMDLVRKYLLEINWHITDENMVFESGKYYTVMKAAPGQEKDSYNEIEIIYGRHLLNCRNKVLREYLDVEYNKFSAIRNTMEENNSINIEVIDKILEYNREAVKLYD